jgi:hypothetical protein
MRMAGRRNNPMNLQRLTVIVITMGYPISVFKASSVEQAKIPENRCSFSLGHFQAKRTTFKSVTV